MADKQQDLARTTLAILFLGGLIVASFLVVQPFLAASVWATTLVIATWPLLLRVQAAFGGRRAPAVAIVTLGLLLIVLLPLSLAIAAIVAHSNQIVALVVDVPNFRVPAPPDWLAGVPVVGEPLAERWQHLADSGVRDIARLARPYVGTITQWFVGAAGNIGGILLHLLLTIAIAAVLYARGERAADWCSRFGEKLAGPRGRAAVELAGQAVRSVALGVVVTAVAQTLVAGLGLQLTRVPQAGLWSAVLLMLCIAQLGPILVMLPATIWLFVTGSPGAGIVLVVFTVVSLVLDNLLRPFLIKRGADLPLLLILVGVIGGLLAFGLLGLFVGPVVLAVSYTLLQNWLADGDS